MKGLIALKGKEITLIHDEMSDRIVEAAEMLATRHGTHSINVRRILTELGITNRVFYNRFHNIDDVLKIVYKNTTLKIRESMIAELDSQKDFFECVTDIVANSLISSYDNKMKFSQYIFESDISSDNYDWWYTEIKRLIDYAIERGYVKKEVDSSVMSYAIWCFCRGYNADAVGRGLPKEEAVKNFRYSFGILLEGMRA